MKVTLCLLTRNELPCLEVIFPAIPPPGPHSGYDSLVAIDGGSTDGTLDFYRRHGVSVIGQSERGRGDAFLKAFARVQSDAYIFFSPDGNEEVRDLPNFKPLLESGADLVIASRMMPGARNEEDGQLLRWRKWANLAFNAAANVAFGRNQPWITDTINGYRAVTARAAALLQLDATDYTIEYQMSIRALRAGLRIVEFPTIEGERVAGQTGAPSLTTGVRFLKRLALELRR